ncbi:MAG: hypothetical protein HXK06_00160 [Actinomyces graevenitzii]|nr:hypothetical protein [Actinomyces graevenitzii]
MENLGKFSVSNIVNSVPADGLGVALVPNGGSYSMVATSSTGGEGGGSDTGWVDITNEFSPLSKVNPNDTGVFYRKIGKVVFLVGKAQAAQVSGTARLPDAIKPSKDVEIRFSVRGNGSKVLDMSLSPSGNAFLTNGGTNVGDRGYIEASYLTD